VKFQGLILNAHSSIANASQIVYFHGQTSKFLPDSSGVRKTGDYASPEGFSISSRFLLTYPQGGRKWIDRAERDSLLLSKSARKTSEGRYIFTGHVRVYSSFAELRDLVLSGNVAALRSFLSGQFIIEFGEEKKKELLETPERMVLRLGL
jgi:hypothetical protein